MPAPVAFASKALSSAVELVIEVTAVAPLLQTDNANVGAEISTKQVTELPLNLRNVVPEVEEDDGPRTPRRGRPPHRTAPHRGIARRAQPKCMGLVTIAASHAHRVHLALQERGIVVHLATHLPVRPVEAFF